MLTIIASAYRADNNLLMNHVNHKRALAELAALELSCKEAVGSWKEEGQESAAQELSLVITASYDSLPALSSLFLSKFKQDAILIINEMEERMAGLLFNDGTSCQLGKFQQISAEEALASECYTYMDGEFYLAKEAA